MGVDMILASPDEAEWEQFRSFFYEKDSFRVSRRLYFFMIARTIKEPPAELDQIAELTGVDVSLLYEMLDYQDEREYVSQLEYYVKDKERVEVLKRENALAKEKVIGNINRVLSTVETLNRKLADIKNLHTILVFDKNEPLETEYYFGDIYDYRGQNLRMDLENLEHHLRHIKEKGVQSVFFHIE